MNSMNSMIVEGNRVGTILKNDREKFLKEVLTFNTAEYCEGISLISEFNKRFTENLKNAVKTGDTLFKGISFFAKGEDVIKTLKEVGCDISKIDKELTIIFIGKAGGIFTLDFENKSVRDDRYSVLLECWEKYREVEKNKASK